jgi:Domain of unknown function (DUF5666)
MTPLSSVHPLSALRLPIILITFAAVSIFPTGCGSAGSSFTGGGGGQKLSGNTSVTVVLSSTANDQLAEFDLEFQSITLTSQSGKTVTLLATQQPSEFIHLNGAIDPLITVTVPQDVYTSATATFAYGSFVCIANGAVEGQGLAFDYYNNNVPAASVTVTLPSPITVTGTSMALALNLLVANSATAPDCLNPNGFAGFSMTPTFNLAPYTLSPSPTSPANGRLAGLEGEVASLDSNNDRFNLSVPEGPYGTRTLSVSVGSATVFQGVSNFSALANGIFVNMDGAIQSDGTLAATRIAVEDPSALNVFTGPLMQVDSVVPVLLVYGRQEQGPLSPGPTGSGYYFDTPYMDFSGAVFQISGQTKNLQTLPFVASFNASNMVGGQNVDISSPALELMGGEYTPANTITLIPQTINGTVVASSQQGSFTDYTVSLAAYDLFPALAVQPGQTTLLTNPSQVEVYVDSNTQMLNTMALAPGNTLRFNGLVFNDNGTLRMDCGQVNDGVSFSQANSGKRLETGKMQSSVRAGARGMQPTIKVVTVLH